MVHREEESAGVQEEFPPGPLDESQRERIINDFCMQFETCAIEEAGCACCGVLNLISTMTLLIDHHSSLFRPLYQGNRGVTRQERKSSTESIKVIRGPVLDKSCSHLCIECYELLARGKIPRRSLANGNWIGVVPDCLKQLTFVEQLLISRIRRNRCIVKVKKSGLYKLRANAILFPNPVAEICDVLPPPRADIEEILAFVFTGPSQPTEIDLQRCPLLVRRNKVADALAWLKLNHIEYDNVHISSENLNQYVDGKPPVSIEYIPREHSAFTIDPAVNTTPDEYVGTESGPCPFTVSGMTGESLQ
ncbi:hypothetical protein SISNIDRAFT_421010, partial [Sistotremastrum niveocremeum HHB9708]